MPTETEKEVIQSELQTYAKNNNFVVFSARSYGSRSRNLESPSSDYDVMFIFAEPPERYMMGTEHDTASKTVESYRNDLASEIEFHGWNIKKFIGNDGIVGSNPTALEFVAAEDTSYYRLGDGRFDNKIENIFTHVYHNFKPYALIQHYRSLASNNYYKYVDRSYKIADGVSTTTLVDEIPIDYNALAEEAIENTTIRPQNISIGSDEVSIVATAEAESGSAIEMDRAVEKGIVEETTTDITTKRYMNVVEAIMRSKFIEETHEMPPMDIDELKTQMEYIDGFNSHMIDLIEMLIAKKRNNVLDEGETYEYLNAFIESELDRTIDPTGLVERNPDREYIQEQTEVLLTGLTGSFNRGHYGLI